MFEHLDDPLQRERDLVAEYGAVVELSASLRRRRSVIVTTLALSLVATGGVCGLALGVPDTVHAPLNTGSLLALGNPNSTAQGLPPILTGSDRTLPGTSPSADAGRPGSSAASAVAVTDAVVVGTVAGGQPGSGGAPTPGPIFGVATSGDSRATSTASGSPSGSAGSSHPLAGKPAAAPPSSTGGGGVQLPGPVVTPPTTTGGGTDAGGSTPGGDTSGGGTTTGGGTDTGSPTGTDGSGTQSPTPDPSPPELPLGDLLPAPLAP